MLTLDLSPGVGPPDVRSGREVQVLRDDGGQTLARAFAGRECRWIEWVGLGTFAFSPTSRTVSGWPVAGADPKVIATHFDRFLQPLILQALGWQTLHAGAILGSAGVLALCGKRGAGKSTLTYAMRQRGWTQIADDALVIRVEPDRITTQPLPFMPRFREASFDFFRKQSLEPLPGFVRPINGHPPLCGAIVLSQDSRHHRPEVRRVEQAEAFSQLLAHASPFDDASPEEIRRLVDDFLIIAEHVPVFGLSYGPNLQRMPDLLDAIASVASDLKLEPAAAAATA